MIPVRRNPGELVTTTAGDPVRNLHAWARAEFTNISYRALAELCVADGYCSITAPRSMSKIGSTLAFAAKLIAKSVSKLEQALERAAGRPWRKAYNKVLAEMSYWHPLPLIDWPL